jgi:hypothetical protein
MVWDPTQVPPPRKKPRRRRWRKKVRNYAAILGSSGGGGGGATDVSSLFLRKPKRRRPRPRRRPFGRTATLLTPWLAFPTWFEPARGTTWAEAARQRNWTAPTMAILVKRAAENRTYWMDMSNLPEVQSGQTLSSPTVTATPFGLTLGSPTISGNKVQVTISSGTDGVLYTLSFQCATSGGATLVGIGYLMVDDQ